jgi:Sec-independent protein translocase protein TatA
MKFFNLGLPEIIFIIILALIIFGPDNMVKTARDAGVLIRKVTKSPYWKEVWATRRELNELPKMLAKEANLDETIRDLNKETRNVTSSVASTVSDFIKEVENPIEQGQDELELADKELKNETTSVNEISETPADSSKVKPG